MKSAFFYTFMIITHIFSFILSTTWHLKCFFLTLAHILSRLFTNFTGFFSRLSSLISSQITTFTRILLLLSRLLIASVFANKDLSALSLDLIEELLRMTAHLRAGSRDHYCLHLLPVFSEYLETWESEKVVRVRWARRRRGQE